MKFLLFLIVTLLFGLTACKTPTSITVSECEQREDGSFICNVNGTPTPRTEFCTYEVTSARGNDCDSLKIDIGKIICVLCTPGQNSCPQPAVFLVKGKDCKIKATKISVACVSCPRGGVPVEVTN
jgi:hypothetical protein